MSVLSPHPWDKVGPPPPLGKPYHVEPAAEEEVVTFVAGAIEAARLLRSAAEKRDEAEELERSADDREREAEPLLATLPKELRDAIEDDPWAIDNSEDVRRAMGRAA